jgi:hypothetical protein
METRESSNSVSTPQEPSSTKNILELPKSALKTRGQELYILHKRKLHRVGQTREGLYRGKCHDVKWEVRLV